jgi:hypothetical protein
MLNDSNWHNLTLYDVNELSSGTYECRSEFGTIVQYELIVSSPNNLNRIYPISSLFDDNIIVKETIYMVNKVKLSCTIDDTDRDYYYGNVVWLAKSSDGQISFISYNGNLVFGKESNHKLNGLDLIVYNTTGLYACYSAVYYPNRYVRLPVYDVKYMT